MEAFHACMHVQNQPGSLAFLSSSPNPFMSTVSASSETASALQVSNVDPELQKINDTKETTEVSINDDDHYKVVMGPEDDPKNLPLALKWFTIVVIAVGAACATSASSMAAFTEPAIMQEFHISRTVAILGISLYVEGLGIGPLLGAF